MRVAPAIIQYFIAEHQGYFAKQGLNINLTTAFLPASTLLPSLGHQYDFGLATMPDVLNAQASGVKTKIVFADTSETSQYPQSFLVAQNSITSIAGLKGKTVAVIAQAGSLYVALLSELKKAGVPASDVRFISMPASTMAQAVLAGRAQAALIPSPNQYPVTAEKSKYHVLSEPVIQALGGSAVDTVVVTSAAWAATHEKLVNAFREAVVQATQWLNSNLKSSTLRTYYTTGMGEPTSELNVSTPVDLQGSPLGLQATTAQIENWVTLMGSLGQLNTSKVNASDLLLDWPSSLSSAMPTSAELGK